MKVLILSRYSNLGGSSRVRIYQYIPYLINEGFDIKIAPLFDDNYLIYYYKYGIRKYKDILYYYIKRLFNLVKIKKYDLLWIEKELLPFFPSWIENIIHLLKIPYIVDYDDAIFHNYDLNKSFFVRNLFGKKIDKIMNYASLVIVGNDYLAERAKNSGAKLVEYIPSAIDIEQYTIKKYKKDKGIFKIGWIGTPPTSESLYLIKDVFKKIISLFEYRLILVGSGNVNLPEIPIEVREWTKETEVGDINDFDVGIMPLYDIPFEKGKCGYKLIQYMACEIPVIGSPVGINNNLIIDRWNGFKPATNDEWINAFDEL